MNAKLKTISLKRKIKNKDKIIRKQDEVIKENVYAIQANQHKSEEIKSEDLESKLDSYMHDHNQLTNFVKLDSESSSSIKFNENTESYDINSDTNIFEKNPNRESNHNLISSLKFI